MDPARAPRDRRVLAGGALLFVASAWATVAWCGAMAGGMRMPGGWTMSMAWMRMSGQSWPAAFALFLGMWVVMMITMMTPSLVPMLLADRAHARARGESALTARSAAVSVAYFLVWTAFGAVAYPVGIALAAAQMRWPAVSRAAPLATGLLLVGIGALQFTAWKRAQLGTCRAGACGPDSAGDRVRGAWRQGLVLGATCVRCCLGLMLALLVLGVMDLWTMAWVGAAITAERVLPRPAAVARVTGLVAIAAGTWLLCKRF